MCVCVSKCEQKTIMITRKTQKIKATTLLISSPRPLPIWIDYSLFQFCFCFFFCGTLFLFCSPFDTKNFFFIIIISPKTKCSPLKRLILICQPGKLESICFVSSSEQLASIICFVLCHIGITSSRFWT